LPTSARSTWTRLFSAAKADDQPGALAGPERDFPRLRTPAVRAGEDDRAAGVETPEREAAVLRLETIVVDHDDELRGPGLGRLHDQCRVAPAQLAGAVAVEPAAQRKEPGALDADVGTVAKGAVEGGVDAVSRLGGNVADAARRAAMAAVDATGTAGSAAAGGIRKALGGLAGGLGDVLGTVAGRAREAAEDAREKLRVAAESVVLPADGAAALEAARRLPDRWVRMAFELDDAPPECRAALEDDMEKLLALKQIPLFAPFDLEQLEALSRVARETTRSPGDPIVREGDAGGDLYVVLSGTVRVVKNHGTPDALHLGDLGPGSYFGEMAIFDERPRSATVIANEPTRVLVLAGDRLKELVVQSPEIAFQIFEVLTTRIREVERRLDRMSRERGRPAGDA